MTHKYLKKLEVKNLFNRFDLNLEFKNKINILYGINGSGKTTVLHILTNALNGDYARFFYLSFSKISILFSNDDYIEIVNNSSNKVILVSTKNGKLNASKYSLTYQNCTSNYYEAIFPVLYFPGFREIIESCYKLELIPEINSNNLNLKKTETESLNLFATSLARILFGQFVPHINHLSLTEIEKTINEEISQALASILDREREIYSDSFRKLFKTLETQQESQNNPEANAEIVEDIKTLINLIFNYPIQKNSMLINFIQESQNYLNKINKESNNLYLEIYRDSLNRISTLRESKFLKIKHYLKAVNEFLIDKQILITKHPDNSNQSFLELDFHNRVIVDDFKMFLSSGERQIMTLIYSVTNRANQNLVLIDEPERSLGIDWQKRLLKKMSEQLSEKQIIVSTHSPPIGRDYLDLWIEVKLVPSEDVKFTYG